MPRYMLDTDICSFILKRSNVVVLSRLRAVPPSDVSISVITQSELLYGVELSPRRDQDTAAVAAFLRHVAALDLSEAAAPHYAEIRAALRKNSEMIGANDLFIAAHARSIGAILVTNNTREFGRVGQRAIENWTLAT
jgi:tRNA(fMet)-specific endonuclease VapC